MGASLDGAREQDSRVMLAHHQNLHSRAFVMKETRDIQTGLRICT